VRRKKFPTDLTQDLICLHLNNQHGENFDSRFGFALSHQGSPPLQSLINREISQQKSLSSFEYKEEQSVGLFGNYPSLKALIDAVAKRDAEAQVTLRRIYGRRYHNFGRKRLRDGNCVHPDDDADDVDTSVWDQIFKTIDTLENPNCFVGWGYKRVKWEVSQHMRSCRKHQALHIDDLIGTKQEPFGELDSGRQIQESSVLLAETLDQCDTIHPKLREIMLLTCQDGLTSEQVGKKVQESPENVRNLLSRGRIKLRAIFRDKGKRGK
jgi:RNA polymerase sigma factor (sigma-70 family)